MWPDSRSKQKSIDLSRWPLSNRDQSRVWLTLENGFEVMHSVKPSSIAHAVMGAISENYRHMITSTKLEALKDFPESQSALSDKYKVNILVLLSCLSGGRLDTQIQKRPWIVLYGDPYGVAWHTIKATSYILNYEEGLELYKSKKQNIHEGCIVVYKDKAWQVIQESGEILTLRCSSGETSKAKCSEIQRPHEAAGGPLLQNRLEATKRDLIVSHSQHPFSSNDLRSFLQNA